MEAMTVAQPEVLANEELRSLQGAQRRVNGRGWKFAVLLTRLLTVSLPIALVALVLDPRPAFFAILTVGFVWFATIRIACDAVPRVAGFGAGIGAGIGVVLGLVSTALIAVVFPDAGIELTHLFAIAAVMVPLSVILESWLERRKPPLRVVVIGSLNRTNELLSETSAALDGRFELVAVASEPLPPPRHALAEIGDIVQREQPDLVVLADSASTEEALDRLLSDRLPSFRVAGLDHFYEYAYGRLPVHSVSPTWFMSIFHVYRQPYRRLSKRALDLVLGTLASILLTPVAFIAALAVRCSGRGPILYRQLRLGESGRPFEIVKFRTMVDGAESNDQAVWAEEDDERVTSVGRVLRRYRLDELPQLWNVLRGEMSIVGPRPERPEFVRRLEQEVPYWTRRQLVKPGITGWAQIRSGYTADTLGSADKLSYDLYYIKHGGLLFDLAIVTKTVGVVFTGNGAR
jgi:exopolysaccharide biosynthesis polyprenyl glycosylphosphotransferase